MYKSLAILLAISLYAYSAEKGGHTHHPDSAKMNLVLDGKSFFLEIMIHDGFYKKMAQVEEFLKLAPSAECKQEAGTVDSQKDNGHMDIKINFNLRCEKPELLKDTEVIFFNTFPKIKSVDVQTVINGNQSSSKITKKDKTIPGL